MTMVRAILDPDLLPIMGRRWDMVTLGLLAALLAFMPAAFGAVEAWSEMIVFAVTALLVIVLALRTIFDPEFRLPRTWMYVPLALFVGLVVFQLLPLPTGLARWLAPTTVATKTELLGSSDMPAITTVGFYPRATAEYLRLVLVGVTVFVTVVSVFRRPRQIKELLLVVFVIGCAEAALAIAQIATGATRIYWRFPIEAPHARAGSFINYSHFCQFMNLSLGAGLAYLLIQLQELRRDAAHGSFRRGLAARINWEKHGWVFCGITLAAITVFTSMSRNGVISLLVASAVIGITLYSRGTLSWRGWILGLVPMCVLFFLLLFGFDAVYERLATLSDTSGIQNRWQLTLGALRAWWASPLWGTGLGTHEVVFPMFDESTTAYLAANADNDYAQLLEETGIVGAALVAAFVAGIATLIVKLILRGRTPVASAAFGIGLGLIAVAIHSATDFGQRVPANFVLSATFCGLLVSIARIEARERLIRRSHSESLTSSSPKFHRVTGAVSLVVLLLVSGWGLTAAYAAFLGERWWAAAIAMDNYIQRAPEKASDQDYVDLLTAADKACQHDPDNVHYGYWLDVYRWQSLGPVIDPKTQLVMIPAETVPVVERIADDLDRVRRLCPTYGPPYAFEGQLRLFVLKQDRGADLIRTGLQLARYDAPTCFVAGQLAVREGRVDEAEPLLTRAVNLSYSKYYPDVIGLYLEAKRPDLARKLAGDDYMRLEHLASATAQIPAYADMTEQLRADAIDTLRRHAAAPDAHARELAALANYEMQKSEFQAAADLYRRALAQEYNNLEWRLNLAQALAAIGNFDDAIHELRICLRLRPEHPQATALLQQWITRRKTN